MYEGSPLQKFKLPTLNHVKSCLTFALRGVYLTVAVEYE